MRNWTRREKNDLGAHPLLKKFAARRRMNKNTFISSAATMVRIFLCLFHPSSGAQGPLCLARYAICPPEPPRGLHTCASLTPVFSLCSQVEFSADTLRLNMIDLGRTGSKLLTVAGTLDFMCQEVEAADPVTFTTKDSHLVSF
jgi:hypothetical protein